jgi:hypothetical protein
MFKELPFESRFGDIRCCAATKDYPLLFPEMEERQIPVSSRAVVEICLCIAS